MKEARDELMYPTRLHILVRTVAVVLLCAVFSGCDDDPLNLGIREGVYTGEFTIRQSDGTEQSF